MIISLVLEVFHYTLYDTFFMIINLMPSIRVNCIYAKASIQGILNIWYICYISLTNTVYDS